MSGIGITCCKNCTKRHSSCHDICQIYKKQKAEHEEILNKEKKYRNVNAFDIESALRAQCQKNNSLRPVCGYARKKQN